MTREPYPCRQPLEGYDARRGQNSDDYFQWLASIVWPDTPAAIADQFEALVDFTADELAVWNA